jgi:signal transduction histidine kinase
VDQDRLHALLDAGSALVSELDVDAILRRLLDTARELTGARYAAIGVLDEQREQLERFLVAGISDDAHRAIGDLPRGRGVLGVLIEDPQPLRLDDVGRHPLSYGFPPGHPPMRTFLGVPILIRGEAWGNLYLTEKPEPFTEADERTTVVLAAWAGIAIANARLYRDEHERRADLERANRALETTTEVARALGGITDLDRALELIAKRSRALVGARAAGIGLIEGEDVLTVAAAGEGIEAFIGTRTPLSASLAGAALRSGRAERYTDLPERTIVSDRLGTRQAIVAPMVFKGRPLGVLTVLDRIDDAPFTPEHVRLLEAFAASAATAVATAQSASDEALRRSLAASEAERARWARELHDETLQELAALKVMLSAARRSSDAARWRAAIDDAVELIGGAVHSLRALIADLRPASLDELGLEAALETLAQRTQQLHGVEVTLAIQLPEGAERSAELEITVYRLVQEALTNVVKHARATRADVRLAETDEAVEVSVRDDGVGFAQEGEGPGFGLPGMRERVALLDGTVDVASRPGEGTAITARIPRRRAPAQAATA